jgi:hypothetical protein
MTKPSSVLLSEPGSLGPDEGGDIGDLIDLVYQENLRVHEGNELIASVETAKAVDAFLGISSDSPEA